MPLSLKEKNLGRFREDIFELIKQKKTGSVPKSNTGKKVDFDLISKPIFCP
jgi:hypothetical protein